MNSLKLRIAAVGGLALAAALVAPQAAATQPIVFDWSPSVRVCGAITTDGHRATWEKVLQSDGPYGTACSHAIDYAKNNLKGRAYTVYRMATCWHFTEGIKGTTRGSRPPQAWTDRDACARVQYSSSAVDSHPMSIETE